MVNPIPSSGRIPSLDGWRALAIILVLGDHAVYASHFPYAELAWTQKIFHGDLGVRIFFVLSGFLISLLLIREGRHHQRVSLGKFYIRRVVRIFPVYFAYLAVLLVLSLAGWYQDSFSSWLGTLTFTRNFVGRGDSATVHFWSLAVEEQFYFVWPIFFVLFSLWKRKVAYLGFLACAIVACPFFRAFFLSENVGGTFMDRLMGSRSIFMYADSLAVGCLSAFFADRLPAGAWTRRCNLYLLLSLGVITGARCAEFVLPSGLATAADALLPSVQAWAIMAALWLSAHPASFLYRFLNWKPVVWIGLLSYSIYIWHVLFLSHFMGEVYTEWMTHHWLFWVIPSLLVATLSYYLLEMPLVALRRNFRRSKGEGKRNE